MVRTLKYFYEKSVYVTACTLLLVAQYRLGTEAS